MAQTPKKNGPPLDAGGGPVRKKSLKQQIRDLKRLLSQDDLPETVRLTKERIAKLLQDELNERATQRKRQKMSKKYRMVKFFDKRKIVRKLSQACKEYQADEMEDSKKAALLKQISRHRLELNYNVHYPPGEKYIALYPSSDPSSQVALNKQGDLLRCIWESIEEGELPDAASQEKGITLPDEVLSLTTLPVIVSSLDHSERVESPDKKPAKRLKRTASDTEGDDILPSDSSGKKKLKQDGFFLLDTN